jgi:hypothetical protein
MTMKLKQISIPIENSHNRLYEFTRALGDQGIKSRALTLVDTGDFGEARLLVSDMAGARQILMQRSIPGRIDDVVAVQLENRPDQLPDLLAALMAADIKVRYGYALSGIRSDSTIMIFRFSDNDKAIQVLGKNELSLADQEIIDNLQAAF